MSDCGLRLKGILKDIAGTDFVNQLSDIVKNFNNNDKFKRAGQSYPTKSYTIEFNTQTFKKGRSVFPWDEFEGYEVDVNALPLTPMESHEEIVKLDLFSSVTQDIGDDFNVITSRNIERRKFLKRIEQTFTDYIVLFIKDREEWTNQQRLGEVMIFVHKDNFDPKATLEEHIEQAEKSSNGNPLRLFFESPLDDEHKRLTPNQTSFFGHKSVSPLSRTKTTHDLRVDAHLRKVLENSKNPTKVNIKAQEAKIRRRFEKEHELIQSRRESLHAGKDFYQAKIVDISKGFAGGTRNRKSFKTLTLGIKDITIRSNGSVFIRATEGNDQSALLAVRGKTLDKDTKDLVKNLYSKYLKESDLETRKKIAADISKWVGTVKSDKPFKNSLWFNKGKLFFDKNTLVTNENIDKILRDYKFNVTFDQVDFINRFPNEPATEVLLNHIAKHTYPTRNPLRNEQGKLANEVANRHLVYEFVDTIKPDEVSNKTKTTVQIAKEQTNDVGKQLEIIKAIETMKDNTESTEDIELADDDPNAWWNNIPEIQVTEDQARNFVRITEAAELDAENQEKILESDELEDNRVKAVENADSRIIDNIPDNVAKVIKKEIKEVQKTEPKDPKETMEKICDTKSERKRRVRTKVKVETPKGKE